MSASRRPRFPETDRARLIEPIAGARPSLPGARPDYPADLETIILKASAREPELRYGSALELAEDLRRPRLPADPRAPNRPGARLIRWSDAIRPSRRWQ